MRCPQQTAPEKRVPRTRLSGATQNAETRHTLVFYAPLSRRVWLAVVGVALSLCAYLSPLSLRLTLSFHWSHTVLRI